MTVSVMKVLSADRIMQSARIMDLDRFSFMKRAFVLGQVSRPKQFATQIVIRSHVGSILSHVYFLTVNKSKPIWQSVFTDLPFLFLVAFDRARGAL